MILQPTRLVWSFALTLVVCTLFSQPVLCGTDEKYDWFLQPKSNALNHSDFNGHLSIWGNLGEVILLDETKLPLRVQFNTGENIASEPILGACWWVPFLESWVVKSDERTIKVYSFTGRILELKEVGEDLFRSQCGTFEGRVSSNTLKILSKDGEMNFVRGRLVSADLPFARGLKWVYRGEKLVRVEQDGRCIAEVDFRSGSAATREIRVGSDTYTFGFTDFPTYAQNAVSPIIVSLRKTAKSCVKDGRKLFDFDLIQELERKQLALEFSNAQAFECSNAWVL